MKTNTIQNELNNDKKKLEFLISRVETVDEMIDQTCDIAESLDLYDEGLMYTFSKVQNSYQESLHYLDEIRSYLKCEINDLRRRIVLYGGVK